VGDPANWDMVHEEMNTIEPKQWLGGSILDYTLLHHWLEMKDNAQVYILTSITVAFLGAGTESEDQITNCRRHIGLSDNGALAMKPIVLIILHANHYFVVVFDHYTSRAHILGSSIQRKGPTFNVTWEGWNGPLLWERTAAAFGWVTNSANNVYKIGHDWHQVSGILVVLCSNSLLLENGYDCGPTTFSVATTFLKHGIHFDSCGHIIIPRLECGHTARLRILKIIHANLYTSYQTWRHVSRTQGTDVWDRQPLETACQAAQNRDAFHSICTRIEVALIKTLDSCQQCKSAYAEQGQHMHKY
jgi:hypothetical protein